MENLEPPKTFLGLNITRKADTISINQAGYIHRMLKRFNMQHAVPAKTPLPHSLPLVVIGSWSILEYSGRSQRTHQKDWIINSMAQKMPEGSSHKYIKTS